MRINLIDKIRREEWEFYVRRRITIFIAIASLVLITGFSMVFLFWGKSVNSILDEQKMPDIERDINQEKQISEKISALNNEIVFLNNSFGSNMAIANVIPVITKMIPAEINLLSVKFIHENRTVSIRGISEGRSGFLKLKQSLEQNNNFYDIYLPMSSVTQQTDIEFTISFKIKDGGFK